MDIIGNKQYREYDRVSRYAVFPFYQHKIDNKYFYGLTSHLSVEDTRYVSHKVKAGDTLDTLALYYYNNPTYFWVIADFNRIRDPYSELEEGTILKIPTFSNITFNI